MQLGAFKMSCLATLKENGFKLTPQRKLMADYFHNSESHLTAEEIIAHVHEKNARRE